VNGNQKGIAGGEINERGGLKNQESAKEGQTADQDEEEMMEGVPRSTTIVLVIHGTLKSSKGEKGG
jgi:hypothetical protein